MTQREREILNWIAENPLISQQELADKAGITRSSAAAHISNLMKKGYIVGKGYIVRTAPYAVVIGGVNMDIGGQPDRKLVAQDSNPGRVRMSLGGVGRNIAHNMALLGVDVRMLTAFGDDLYAQKLAASCGELGIDISHALQVPGGTTSTYLFLGVDVRMLTAFGDDLYAQKLAASCGELGIDISHALQVPGGTTSTYLFLNDERGDMALAVSDMEIYAHVTPAYLSAQRGLLDNAQLIVFDTNIPAETIAWLAEHAKVPLFSDPVSTAKAEKLRPVLGKLHTLKPNRIEAELLSGVPITDAASLDRAADALLETGLRRVLISLGGDGIFAADHRERFHVPCYPGSMVNTTGCGDAAMAAVAWAYLEGTDLLGTARAALAAGAVAMESGETINPAMSADALKARMAL